MFSRGRMQLSECLVSLCNVCKVAGALVRLVLPPLYNFPTLQHRVILPASQTHLSSVIRLALPSFTTLQSLCTVFHPRVISASCLGVAFLWWKMFSLFANPQPHITLSSSPPQVQRPLYHALPCTVGKLRVLTQFVR